MLGLHVADHRLDGGTAFHLPADGSGTGRDYSLGWRLVRGGSGSDGGSLELSFEATRRESANVNAGPEHAIGLRATARW